MSESYAHVYASREKWENMLAFWRFSTSIMLAYLRGGARSDPPWMLPNVACHINVTCGLHVDAKVNMIGDAEKLLHYMVPTCSKLTVLSRVSSAYPSQISTFQMQKKCKFTDKKTRDLKLGTQSHICVTWTSDCQISRSGERYVG